MNGPSPKNVDSTEILILDKLTFSDRHEPTIATFFATIHALSLGWGSVKRFHMNMARQLGRMWLLWITNLETIGYNCSILCQIQLFFDSELPRTRRQSVESIYRAGRVSQGHVNPIVVPRNRLRRFS